jgi:signal transduction histidine kinase
VGLALQHESPDAAVERMRRSLRDENARLSRDLEAVLALDELVLQVEDFGQLARGLVDRARALTRVPSAGLMLVDEERKVLNLLPGSYGAPEDDVSSGRFSATDPGTIAGRVFTTGEPCVTNSVTEDTERMSPNAIERRIAYFRLYGLTRLLTLPLRAQGRQIGLLHLANKPTPFTARDVERAQTVAPWIATILELGRMVLDFRRQQQIERVLGDFAVGIASGRSIQPLITSVLGGLSEQLLVDLAVLKPYSAGEAVVWRRDGGAVSAEIEEAIIQDAEHGEELAAQVREPAGAGDPGHALLLQPLKLGVARIGTVCAFRGRADSFADFERNAVARFASMTAVAMQSERYRRQRAELTRLRERQRIADDLHDHAAQLLFISKIKLEALLDEARLGEPHATTIREACGLLERCDEAIREVIRAVLPPPNSDLASRLAVLVDELEQEFDVPIQLDVTEEIAEAAKSMRKASADLLVRVAQETIVNAVKHGDPCVVSMSLRPARDGKSIVMSVRDDGIGISEEKKQASYGLQSLRRSLREHGGSLRVSRGPVGGTSVVARLSL